MLLQAYDFYHLMKNHNCVLQMGGSDQWGNIINGVELIKRYSGKQSFGLTTPLITLASGAKMGKTESGAVWLDKSLLSSYDYWQFWRNTDDRDVIKFLKMFTNLSLDEVDKIKEKNINDLKIVLANKATEMLHGEKLAKESEKMAISTFKNNSTGENLPNIKIKKDILDQNIIELASFVTKDISKSEIRRMIKANGIKINNKLVSDDKFIISSKLFNDKGFLKLSIGKKNNYKIII